MASLPCSSALWRLVFYAAVPSLLLSRLSFPIVHAQTVGIVCFGVGNQSYVNNTRCPGSNACCGHQATCLSNRLCHNPGDPEDLWVRGPCAVSPFDETCGQICLYDEVETGGGVLPRVTQCADGSLCCNNDPQCCQNRRGVFLDENGNRVSTRATEPTTSYPPTGTGTDRFTLTPSVSTTSAPTTGSTTETSSSSRTSGGADSSDTALGAGGGGGVSDTGAESTTGLKVGLGLGIPLAVLVSAGAVYFFLRRRNKKAQESGMAGGPPASISYLSEPAMSGYTPTPPLKVETPYYAGQPLPQQPAELGSPGVAELPSHRRYEMS